MGQRTRSSQYIRQRGKDDYSFVGTAKSFTSAPYLLFEADEGNGRLMIEVSYSYSVFAVLLEGN